MDSENQNESIYQTVEIGQPPSLTSPTAPPNATTSVPLLTSNSYDELVLQRVTQTLQAINWFVPGDSPPTGELALPPKIARLWHVLRLAEFNDTLYGHNWKALANCLNKLNNDRITETFTVSSDGKSIIVSNKSVSQNAPEEDKRIAELDAKATRLCLEAMVRKARKTLNERILGLKRALEASQEALSIVDDQLGEGSKSTLKRDLRAPDDLPGD